MKNYPLLKAVLVGLTLLALAITIALRLGTKEKTDPVVQKSRMSVPSEFQKKFMAIRVLEVEKDRSLVDVFGEPLVAGQWYLMMNKTMVLFPIHNKNTGNIMLVGADELDNLSFPLSGNYQKSGPEEIVVNAGKFSKIIKAQVLMTGKDEIKMKNVNIQSYLQKN